MPIANYAQLQTAIADWAERGDLTARIPDFIALAESRLNRRFTARTMQSEVALATVVGSRFVALPAAFREPVTLWLERTTGRTELRLVDAGDLDASNTPGQPGYWAIDGTNIAFERPTDLAYSMTLRMVGGLALSDANPTNLFLTNYPDLYLFGAMVEAGPFLRDAELLATFEARFQNALAEAEQKEAEAEGRPALRTEWPQLQRRGSFDIRTGD